MFGLKTSATALEEIVFENRNKLYGAYWLRTHYYENVLSGFYFSCSFVGGAIAFYVALHHWRPMHEVTTQGREVVLYVSPPHTIICPLPPPGTPLPKSQQKGIRKAGIGFTVPEITTEPDQDLVPTMDKFKDKSAGPTTQQGDSGVGQDAMPGTPNGTGTSAQGEGGGIDTEASPLNFAEDMPVADYDMAAFIAKHALYPEIDIRNEITGVVYVGFVVETDGGISDVKILKGLSPTTDASALKAVEQLPPLRPGRQGNHPVRVRMTVPVRFVLN